jgi:imidazolonepropionase
MAPPPVERLRAAGVPLAVASDLNPGTGWCESLTVPMWLATTHYGMTIDEAWLGVTRHAARALGRSDLGHLTPGAVADLVLWDTDEPADIPYRFTKSFVKDVFRSDLN